MTAIAPASEKYFYGRISREAAEEFLGNHGNEEGMFLLREKINMGNYALSICHDNKVHHYSIDKQPDNMVMIQDGKKFAGPVELIEHHKNVLDGFLTKPQKPCNRPDNYPIAWPGVLYTELDNALLQYCQQRRLTQPDQLENVFGPQRSKVVAEIAKNYHETQPWYHGIITRDEAEKIISKAGHQNGRFLVRQKDEKSFALSLSYNKVTKHYKIHKELIPAGIEKLAIEDGPRFDNLMDMIAHYYNKKDGLLCQLSDSVPSKKRRAATTKDHSNANIAYGLLPADSPVQPLRRDSVPGLALFKRFLRPSDRPLPPMPVLEAEGDWEGPVDSVRNGTRAPRPGNANVDDEALQKIYDVLPRTDDVFNLNKENLSLKDTLGAGNFGDVMKGEFILKGKTIPVAVKTLKQADIPNAESDIMKEAKNMADLQHRNIVRLIGVCRSSPLMLVMELAQLGPLNKYLKAHENLAMKSIIEVMAQVAEGMSYLESKNFVHRDLAARNVLLVSERFAKISDFGMSKALGLGNDYYKAATAGKWPLKWYAPECIFYFRFDTKSDVWSYGVTLWEATSYGARPYRGLKGQQILTRIEEGERLQKPKECPDDIYQIMLSCWEFNKEDRPGFSEIADLMRNYQRRN